MMRFAFLYMKIFCCSALVLLSEMFPLQAQKSMDELDRISFRAGLSPLERDGFRMEKIKNGLLGNGDIKNTELSLSGEWLLAEDGLDGRPEWDNSIQAIVPGSIHEVLFKAGRIPDPMIGRNDSVAEKHSYHRWWLKRIFENENIYVNPKLRFAGVANHCWVWLNGHCLGEHEGMFGGPDFEIKEYLKAGKNELVVLLDSIPRVYNGGWPATANEAWKQTVVVNCVYGWHYAKIPSLGIWQDVFIEDCPPDRIENAFIATKDLSGEMRLNIDLKREQIQAGGIRVRIEPYNFEGETQEFFWKFKDNSGNLNLDFKLDNPKLWYPNGMGEQSLYKATVDLLIENQVIDRKKVVFGVRTIEMASLPGGPRPDKYNWTFVINGVSMFVKGAGWCTMDTMLDFSEVRYRHFLTAARDQHIQMLRAWGGGLPETDIFYRLCDELGIMVMQEWPTAWDSHKTQPVNVLKETVVRNTLRLRNHPSLVMWGAGNESSNPFGEMIDFMGKVSIELDGTRPFHRGEAWGGSKHNYNCWWDGLHLNHNLNMTADFWGEFGIPSLPLKEHVLYYLDGEEYSWPVDKNGNFAHHTPIFGTNGELEKLEQYSGYFMPDSTLDCMILGSQLAQVEGVRHTLERARTRWPYCTGALYYKLNDNYPGLSWSSIDYYGGVKPLHYFLKRSYAPLVSVLLFDRTNMAAQQVSLPHYLLDENERWCGKEIKVRVSIYNQDFKEVLDSTIVVFPEEKVSFLGDVSLNVEQTDVVMLYYKTDVMDAAGKVLARNWYFTNYETKQGCILESKRSKLSYSQNGRILILKNNDVIPAVGVTVEVPGKASSLLLSDNYFWMDPGEEKKIEINVDGIAVVKGWNVSIVNE